MPKWRARVEVALKPGFYDPEGETTRDALRDLGYNVDEVRVSKLYTITLEANSKEEAEKLVEEMCRRLLANPTKDTYTYTIEED